MICDPAHSTSHNLKVGNKNWQVFPHFTQHQRQPVGSAKPPLLPNQRACQSLDLLQLAFECSTSFHIIDILRLREHWYGQTHCCRQTHQGNTWLDSNTKWSRWVRILPGPSKEQKYLIRLSARCSASCSSCLTTFRWCRNCRLVRSRCDYLHACTCSEQTYPAK